MEKGTYIIETYTVNHPTEGDMTKQQIIYYNQRDEIVTLEFYDGYIRPGYTLKNISE